MALRNRLPSEISQFPLPERGVNLSVQSNLLAPDQWPLMQNYVLDGAVDKREGMRRINATALDANKRVSGGTKYYYRIGSTRFPTSTRLVTYGTNLSKISDNGLETAVATDLTDDADTFFNAWPFTRKLYISNGEDTLRAYDGPLDSYATLTGTNIPTPIARVIGLNDRMFAITPDGIERTNPGVDNVWSLNNWATFKGSQEGHFTALYPWTFKTISGFIEGALAFQDSSYYRFHGTNFGSNVDSASVDINSDAAINLVNDDIGTSSPSSVVEVPGVGLFWFTSDFNVYHIPANQLTGGYVANSLRSVIEIPGIESVHPGFLDKVWMKYLFPYLMLGIPEKTSPYTSQQWWMDVRVFGRLGPVWFGPMVGQTLSTPWVEKQLQDNFIFAGEGDPAKGAYVYQLRAPKSYTDMQGSVDADVVAKCRTFLNAFGAPNLEKRLQSIHYEASPFAGDVTIRLYDINGLIVDNLEMTEFTPQ